MEILELNYLDLEENKNYEKIIKKVLQKCFEEENLQDKKLYVNVVLTNDENIRNINREHRQIDKPTDVLSFPMYERDEISTIKKQKYETILGDILISIPKVQEQAIEYEHSFKRELA